MLNGVSRKERLTRTIIGARHNIDDFFFIIEAYVEKLTETEMRNLYELEEDVK